MFRRAEQHLAQACDLPEVAWRSVRAPLLVNADRGSLDLRALRQLESFDAVARDRPQIASLATQRIFQQQRSAVQSLLLYLGQAQRLGMRQSGITRALGAYPAFQFLVLPQDRSDFAFRRGGLLLGMFAAQQLELPARLRIDQLLERTFPIEKGWRGALPDPGIQLAEQIE